MKAKLMTLQDKAEIVKRILNESPRHRFWVGTATSDDDFERVIISADRLYLHKHQIERIEKEADLELAWMDFWNEPALENIKKGLGKGKSWHIMFVKDLRGQA